MSKIFDYEIKFDSKGLENDLMDTFGIGGKVQERWDNIVFDGIRPYAPFLTGTMLANSYAATVMGSGELNYVGPQARRLYYNPQYKFTGAPMRGGRWAERAERDLKAAWIAELQRFINGG